MMLSADEKRQALRDFCNGRGGCDDVFDGVECPLINSSCYELRDLAAVPDETVNELYKKAFGEEDTQDNTPEDNPVTHPTHYTNGGMECIDEMVLIFGVEAVKWFCVCNAWKYRRRALYKNKEEDMEKSHWYLAKYKELNDVSEGTIRGL